MGCRGELEGSTCGTQGVTAGVPMAAAGPNAAPKLTDALHAPDAPCMSRASAAPAAAISSGHLAQTGCRCPTHRTQHSGRWTPAHIAAQHSTSTSTVNSGSRHISWATSLCKPVGLLLLPLLSSSLLPACPQPHSQTAAPTFGSLNGRCVQSPSGHVNRNAPSVDFGP